LKKKAIYIFGYSGHAYVVIEAIDKKKYTLEGYFEFNPIPLNPYNIPYLGYEKDEAFLSIVQHGCVFPAMGSNTIREKVTNFLSASKIAQINIIAPSAIVSRTAYLGESVFISNGAIINAQVEIGNGSIINTGAVIEHECKIGNFTHIAPSAVLAGNVTVGDRTFIGSNTVIKQGITIGKDVIIGAGSVVIRDITDGKKVVGNPSREI
jgi:sugar O-acyltransferase (sialic acid O-acetyltransferase NeuD family)